jgi:hypothetical protein
MLYLEAVKQVEKGFIQDLKLINRRLIEEMLTVKETNSPI